MEVNKMEKSTKNGKCNKETEVYSRVVGYFRPIKNWNDGKREEFANRVTFNEKKALESKIEHKTT
jgi:anaerobic ribonucleoside-triphosphate reductase